MRFLRVLALLGALAALMLLVGAGGVLYVFYHYGRDLPDYQQLAEYEPPTVTRIYAGDGRLLDEYAREKRIFVPIEAIPKRVVKAFLAAEDKNFYSHPGVDFLSLARAVVTNLRNIGSNRRPVGASTITQQVAKNFLLTNEVSIERKIKEAILAFRIERAFTKDHILELYLNEIYLGGGAYGVAAAALNYFDKSLDELTIEETAFLAALPKAPNNYHPVRHPRAAKARRDWVIARMAEEQFITEAEARAAREMPLEVRKRRPEDVADADYFTEEVRRRLIAMYGDDGLYEGGLAVHTTVDPHLQAIADKALRDGLIAYDRRHGWRGPIATVEPAKLGKTPPEKLFEKLRPVEGIAPWRRAVVLEAGGNSARILVEDAGQGRIMLEDLAWARPALDDGDVGAKVTRASDVLSPGDVVLVDALDDGEAEGEGGGRYRLMQLPKVSGGLIALDPHTGRVLAMTGGFSFEGSEFNRVTQAKRQPGSAFKPFVYLTALEDGFTPASIVLDAPLAIDQGEGLGKWKPANHSERFFGPSTLRRGIEKSRNIMTVRLAREIGMDRVVETARRFGIGDYDPLLSVSLGAGETRLIDLATAYAMLVNGGKRIEPALVERIQDRHGKTVYRRDDRACDACRDVEWRGQSAPALPDNRRSIVDPRKAYQMVHILEGVVQRGTGSKARSIGKPLAGKTGTTNESRDAWFMGFSPDLVVGVYVGFDNPRTLGEHEYGSTAALPVWMEFMEQALADKPAIPFRIPEGIRLVRIDADSGLLPGPATKRTIVEAFTPGNEPTRVAGARDAATDAGAGSLPSGTGGLY